MPPDDPLQDAPLTGQKCTACEGGTPPLGREQAEELHQQVPEWSLSEDRCMLGRDFYFKDFKAAVAFINAVADLAEAEGHHPDIHCRWNKVRLELTTHAIKGLSRNDFIMAAKIDRLA